MLNNYTPPQYADEATPRGALVRALEAQYPHSLPADKIELAVFVAGWALNQYTDRPYIGISEIVATLESWMAQRKASMS